MRGKPGSTRTRRITLGAILFFGVLFRAELVAQQPFLSSDVYRYVWDGRVQAAGINPYRYKPEAEELSLLRDDRIFPNITAEDRGWLSAYPPAAQAVFLMAYKALPSVAGFKIAMSAFDLAAVLLIMLTLSGAGLDPARAIIFAWHPLVIFETAHSGHVESAYIAFIALALWAWSRRSYALAGVGLALATAVKFYPALLLPVFLVTSGGAQDQGGAGPRIEGRARSQSLANLWNGSNLRMCAGFIATIVAAYLPYIAAGSNLFGFLGGYFSEEGFGGSGSRYFVLTLLRKVLPIPTLVFLIPAALALLWLSARLLVREKRNIADVAQGACAVVGAYLLLTTPRYAWYYLWLLPFLCFAPSLGWLYLTGASSLLYLVWYTPLVYPEVPLWLGAVVYLPSIGFLVWERLADKGKGSKYSVAPAEGAAS